MKSLFIKILMGGGKTDRAGFVSAYSKQILALYKPSEIQERRCSDGQQRSVAE